MANTTQDTTDIEESGKSGGNGQFSDIFIGRKFEKGVVRIDRVAVNGVDIRKDDKYFDVKFESEVQIFGKNLDNYDSVSFRIAGQPYTPQNVNIFAEKIRFTIPDYEKMLSAGGEIRLEFSSFFHKELNAKLYNRLLYKTREQAEEDEKEAVDETADEEKDTVNNRVNEKEDLTTDSKSSAGSEGNTSKLKKSETEVKKSTESQKLDDFDDDEIQISETNNENEQISSVEGQSEGLESVSERVEGSADQVSGTQTVSAEEEISGQTLVSTDISSKASVSGSTQVNLRQSLDIVEEHLAKNTELVIDNKVRGEILSSLKSGNVAGMSVEAKTALQDTLKVIGSSSGQTPQLSAAVSQISQQLNLSAQASVETPSASGGAAAPAQQQSVTGQAEVPEGAAGPAKGGSSNQNESQSAEQAPGTKIVQDQAQSSGAAQNQDTPSPKSQQPSPLKSAKKSDEEKTGQSQPEPEAKSPDGLVKSETGSLPGKGQVDGVEPKPPEGLGRLADNDVVFDKKHSEGISGRVRPNERPSADSRVKRALRKGLLGASLAINAAKPGLADKQPPAAQTSVEKPPAVKPAESLEQKKEEGSPSQTESQDEQNEARDKENSEENDKDEADEPDLDEENQSPVRALSSSLDPAASEALDKGIKILNEFINGWLLTVILGVWVGGAFTLLLGIILGAIVGDFLWAFKKPLIRFASNRIKLPLVDADLFKKAGNIAADKIKFSWAVKANIIAMNFIVVAAICLTILIFGSIIDGLCSNWVTGGLTEYFSGFENACHVFDGQYGAIQPPARLQPPNSSSSITPRP